MQHFLVKIPQFARAGVREDMTAVRQARCLDGGWSMYAVRLCNSPGQTFS